MEQDKTNIVNNEDIVTIEDDSNLDIDFSMLDIGIDSQLNSDIIADNILDDLKIDTDINEINSLDSSVDIVKAQDAFNYVKESFVSSVHKRKYVELKLLTRNIKKFSNVLNKEEILISGNKSSKQPLLLFKEKLWELRQNPESTLDVAMLLEILYLSDPVLLQNIGYKLNNLTELSYPKNYQIIEQLSNQIDMELAKLDREHSSVDKKRQLYVKQLEEKVVDINKRYDDLIKSLDKYNFVYLLQRIVSIGNKNSKNITYKIMAEKAYCVNRTDENLTKFSTLPNEIELLQKQTTIMTTIRLTNKEVINELYNSSMDEYFLKPLMFTYKDIIIILPDKEYYEQFFEETKNELMQIQYNEQKTMQSIYINTNINSKLLSAFMVNEEPKVNTQVKRKSYLDIEAFCNKKHKELISQEGLFKEQTANAGFNAIQLLQQKNKNSILAQNQKFLSGQEYSENKRRDNYNPITDLLLDYFESKGEDISTITDTSTAELLYAKYKNDLLIELLPKIVNHFKLVANTVGNLKERSIDKKQSRYKLAIESSFNLLFKYINKSGSPRYILKIIIDNLNDENILVINQPLLDSITLNDLKGNNTSPDKTRSVTIDSTYDKVISETINKLLKIQLEGAIQKQMNPINLYDNIDIHKDNLSYLTANILQAYIDNKSEVLQTITKDQREVLFKSISNYLNSNIVSNYNKEYAIKEDIENTYLINSDLETTIDDIYNHFIESMYLSENTSLEFQIDTIVNIFSRMNGSNITKESVTNILQKESKLITKDIITALFLSVMLNTGIQSIYGEKQVIVLPDDITELNNFEDEVDITTSGKLSKKDNLINTVILLVDTVCKKIKLKHLEDEDKCTKFIDKIIQANTLEIDRSEFEKYGLLKTTIDMVYKIAEEQSLLKFDKTIRLRRLLAELDAMQPNSLISLVKDEFEDIVFNNNLSFEETTEQYRKVLSRTLILTRLENLFATSTIQSAKEELNNLRDDLKYKEGEVLLYTKRKTSMAVKSINLYKQYLLTGNEDYLKEVNYNDLPYELLTEERPNYAVSPEWSSDSLIARYSLDNRPDILESLDTYYSLLVAIENLDPNFYSTIPEQIKNYVNKNVIIQVPKKMRHLKEANSQLQPQIEDMF